MGLSDDEQQAALIPDRSNSSEFATEKGVQSKSNDIREADENMEKTVDVNNDSIAGVKGVDWILKQDGGRYTLQLVALQDVDDIHSFVKKYSTLDGLALFRTTKKNQDWYALIHGIYPTISVAKEKARSLPQALRKSWPRKLKSVQNSIAKFASRR